MDPGLVRPKTAPGPQSWPAEQPGFSLPGHPPPRVEVRTYTGKTAQATYEIDAAQMSQAGWFPVTSTWVEGKRNTWFLGLGVIGLFLLLLPGIAALITWAIFRGPGSLTVPYQYHGNV